MDWEWDGSASVLHVSSSPSSAGASVSILPSASLHSALSSCASTTFLTESAQSTPASMALANASAASRQRRSPMSASPRLRKDLAYVDLDALRCSDLALCLTLSSAWCSASRYMPSLRHADAQFPWHTQSSGCVKLFFLSAVSGKVSGAFVSRRGDGSGSREDEGR